jgi:CHAD domain-containing protein
VLTHLTEELRAREIYSAKALDLMTAAFARERALLKQRMKSKLTPAKLRRLAARLGEAARYTETNDASAIPGKNDRTERGWRWALEARVARRSSQLREAVDRTGPLYRRAELHDVRIAAKKLRYTLELWQETGRGGASGHLRTLKANQDLLGRLHDLEVLIEWVRDAQASFAPPDLATWRVFGVLVRDLENECRLLHARYVTNRSKLLEVCERTVERPESQPTSRRAVG